MLSEELNQKLETLKKAASEFHIFANAVDGKKLMKETDVSSLETKIKKLKETHEEHQAKASSILQNASDEASQRINHSKEILQQAINEKNQALKDKEEAIKLKNEATALMSQAVQRQKEADIAYAQYDEKRKKILEAAR